MVASYRALAMSTSATLLEDWHYVNGTWMHSWVSARQSPSGTSTLVLVHGFGVAGESLLPTARKLAAYYTVLVPEIPGYGGSRHTDAILDISGQAEAVWRWTQALGLHRVTLVGNSVGSQVVAALASQHPELVERVVLVAPTVDSHAHSVRQLMARWILNSLHEPLAQGGVSARSYYEIGIRRTIHTIRYIVEDHIEERLAYLRCPTLVVHGERDPLVPRRWTRQVVSTLPDARLVTIPDATHGIVFNAPDELAKAIRKFLNSKGETQH